MEMEGAGICSPILPLRRCQPARVNGDCESVSKKEPTIAKNCQTSQIDSLAMPSDSLIMLDQREKHPGFTPAGHGCGGRAGGHSPSVLGLVSMPAPAPSVAQESIP